LNIPINNLLENGKFENISLIPHWKTKLAKAVQYAKNEKKYFQRFLEDGDVPIDNNRAENAIRLFVIGRKNWLFSNSVKGTNQTLLLR